MHDDLYHAVRLAVELDDSTEDILTASGSAATSSGIGAVFLVFNSPRR